MPRRCQERIDFFAGHDDIRGMHRLSVDNNARAHLANEIPSLSPELTRLTVILLGALGAPLLFALLGLCGGANAQGFADEDRDWGVAAPERIRGAPYSAPTPVTIPGASVIATRSLQELIQRGPPPVLVDVAAGEGHATLEGSVWIPGAGRGSNFIDPLQGQFSELLIKLTQGDKARPLVFFCVNSQCWLSYNAALRAVAAGFTRVFWYRGGIDAWRAAGHKLVRMELTER
jgi:PQQ-dependent catabolism-associated CXXCW motif protein